MSVPGKRHKSYLAIFLQGGEKKGIWSFDMSGKSVHGLGEYKCLLSSSNVDSAGKSRKQAGKK